MANVQTVSTKGTQTLAAHEMSLLWSQEYHRGSFKM